MDNNRSEIGIVQIDVEVNSWRARLPDVDSVRPAHCPKCNVPSREPGCGLSLHGHGIVTRQQWGPSVFGQEPQFGEIALRRYRCKICHAIIRVGPSGIIHRHLYSGAAIAVSLALWISVGLAARDVRRRISPLQRFGACAADEWRSLARWLQRLLARRLWPHHEVPREPPASCARSAGKAMLGALSVLAPGWSLSMPIDAAVFAAASRYCGGPSAM